MYGVMSLIEEPLLSIAILLARICLAAVFLVSGIHKAIWFSKSLEEFRHARVPLVHFSVTATIVLHLLASLGLLTGILVMESAIALAAFTLLATIRVHDFWNRGGRERLISSRNALANLAVIGGLILLAATGPGELTL